jgi:hypothetical protein
MGLKRFFAPAMGVFLIVVTQSSLAEEDPFHLTYRLQNLSSDGLTQSGILLVGVVNVSGGDVQQVVASVPGPNNVTFDNRTILIGDLPTAEQKEVLDEFHVPQELADLEAIEDSITWAVEYTNSAGERLIAEVTGERVPE